jgi:hypothetical protein
MRRLAPYLVTLTAALLTGLALVSRPAAGAPKHTVDYVVIVGAAGLRWEDLTPTDTPTLWRLAHTGSMGALSVRSGHEPTCPADGWATLGAGNYAQLTFEPMDGPACPPIDVQITTPDSNGAYLPDWAPREDDTLPSPRRPGIVARNRGLGSAAQLGALAESVRCTAAVGPGAAIAAARPTGQVDRYAATPPANLDELLAACVLSIVDAGTVTGVGPARQLAAQQADATLARVLAARPPRSLLLVAGLADTDTESRLHVAIADGPGYDRGWLSSPSTGRSKYLQLVDLAPTALAALGRPAPSKLFAGAAAIRDEGYPPELTAAVDRLADADREASAQRQVSSRFFAVLAACQLALFVGVIPLLRRARRPAGPVTIRPSPRWLARGTEVLLVAAALAVPAALLADLVPWWRFRYPGLVFAAVTTAVLAASTTAIALTGFGRRTFGPLGGVASLAAAAVGVDVLTGSRLQLNGVAGYSALAGGRYAGLGTVGLGVFIAGALLAAAWLAQRVRRPWRAAVVAVAGGVGVVLVGSPYLGADPGGAVALTAGVCLAAALASGGWLSFARVAWAVLAGLAVTTAFAIFDFRRPAEHRGGLGRFLEAVSEGTGRLAVHRTGVANVVTLATSPLTVLALGSAVFIGFVLLRPWGGLKRLYGLHPPVRGAMAGITVATIMAGAVEGAGFNVAGAAAATALPLATLATLRVLAHADDRTQPRPPAPVTVIAPPPAPAPLATEDVAVPAAEPVGGHDA